MGAVEPSGHTVPAPQVCPCSVGFVAPATAMYMPAGAGTGFSMPTLEQ